MAMLMSRETAIIQIGPERLDRLRACFVAAWGRYEAQFRPHLPLCDPTAMATILRELVLEEARRTFSDQPGVVILDGPRDRRFLLVIDDALVVQVKKLTQDFQTVNNPTETSKAFDRQLPIEGFPSVPRLTAGYKLGQYGTQMSGIWLIFLVGKQCLWHYDLETGEHSLTLDLGVPRPTEGEGAADQEADEERRRKARERLGEAREDG